MSQAKHTPGPWFITGSLTQYIEAKIGGGFIQEVASVGPTESDGGYGPQQKANARLIAAAPDLLEALEEYRIAHAMSSYGDYSAIEWESKAGPVNPDWGGGDCEKHGRWYGMCHCCRDEWKRLCDQSDRDAVRARNNALRAADDKANAAIAKATGCE